MFDQAFCRSTSSRPRQKSVDMSDRPMCTNVHSQFGWRAGRPPESSALWKAPVGGVDRPAKSSALCSRPRSTGPVDRGSTVRNMTVGQSTGPVDRQPSRLLIWLQRLVFSRPIKYGFLGLFYTRLLESFKASISHLFQRFSPLV